MGITVPLTCPELELGFWAKKAPVFILLSFLYCDISVFIRF